MAPVGPPHIPSHKLCLNGKYREIFPLLDKNIQENNVANRVWLASNKPYCLNYSFSPYCTELCLISLIYLGIYWHRQFEPTISVIL